MSPTFRPPPTSLYASTSASSMLLVSHTVPTSPEARIPDTGAEGAEWTHFVEEYAKGHWDGTRTPAPPAAVQRLAAERSELHLYSSSPSSSIASSGEGSTTSTGESPADLLEFYRRNGHMPAPRGEFEEERLRIIKRYGIDQPRRRAAVEAICSIAKSHFKTSTVIVSLVFEGHQVLAAEAGWAAEDPGPDEPPRPVELAPSLCAHGVTRTDLNSLFVVPDAANDWRFANNPYLLKNGGILAFYASANIHLPSTSPSTSSAETPTLSTPPTLPVGSLCLIDNRPHAPDTFSDADALLLRQLAGLIGREFELGYEQITSEATRRQSEFLGEFLHSHLVKTSAPSNIAPTTAALNFLSRRQSLAEGRSDAFTQAANELRRLTTGARVGCCIIDLSDFRIKSIEDVSHSPEIKSASPRRTRPSMGRSHTNRGIGVPSGELRILGSDGEAHWQSLVDDERTLSALASSLRTYTASGRCDLERHGHSGLGSWGDILPKDTLALTAIPILNHDRHPEVLVLLTSTEDHFRFDERDHSFILNTGALVLAVLARERVIAADAAKLAFISQVSHELRTPLHSVASQLELIRELEFPASAATLLPYLDVTEVCLENLRDVLDDTLDFSKLTNSTAAQKEESYQRSLVEVDLEDLVANVVKATAVRTMRVNATTTTAEGLDSKPRVPLDIIFDCEDRVWNVLVDSAGIKRCLLNLLGNALKFTTSGFVKVSLRVARSTTSAARTGLNQTVIVEVEDSGRGMSPEFLSEGVFTPFLQEDPFAPGVGLGMSICQTIVRRNHGTMEVESTLGKGTKIMLSLPLEFRNSPAAIVPLATPPLYAAPRLRPIDTGTLALPHKRRILSEELSVLFKTFEPHPDSVSRSNHTQPPIPRRGSSHRDKAVLGTQLDSTDLQDELERFRISSPRSTPGTSVVSVPVGGSDDPVAKPSLAPLVSVLIAEDNHIARTILAKFLEGKGISYAIAENGQVAVDKYKAGYFNIGLFDIQMPLKDGVEAAHNIRTFEKENGLPRCRIVALTGLSGEADMEKAIALDGPMDLWLVKGGQSLKVILREITDLQEQLEEAVGVAPGKPK